MEGGGGGGGGSADRAEIKRGSFHWRQVPDSQEEGIGGAPAAADRIDHAPCGAWP